MKVAHYSVTVVSGQHLTDPVISPPPWLVYRHINQQPNSNIIWTRTPYVVWFRDSDTTST